MTLRKFILAVPFLLAVMLAMAMMPMGVAAYTYVSPDDAIKASSEDTGGIIGTDCVQYDDSMESASDPPDTYTATIDAMEGHELRFYESEDGLHQYVFVCPPPGETVTEEDDYYSDGALKETTAQLANSQQAGTPDVHRYQDGSPILDNKDPYDPIAVSWNGVAMTMAQFLCLQGKATPQTVFTVTLQSTGCV